MISLGTKTYRIKGTEDTTTSPKPGEKVTDGTGMYYYSSYSKLYIKNDTIKIDSLVDEMKIVLDTLQSLAEEKNLKGFTITSGNDYTGHVKNSYHYKDKAIDISFRESTQWNIIPEWVTKSGTLFQSFRNTINDNFKDNQRKFRVLIEGDHIHVEHNPTSIKLPEELQKQVETKSTDNAQQKVTTPTPIAYYHTDPTITSLEALINDPYSLFGKYRDEKTGKATPQTIKELEDFEGGTGVTNKERILLSYFTTEEQTEVTDLPTGVLLYLEPTKIDRDFLVTSSKNQVTDMTSFPRFIADVQKKIEESPLYRPRQEINQFSKNLLSVPVDFTNNFMSVWVYCKALDEIIDITDFCKSTTTTTTTTNADTFEIEAIFFNGDTDIVQSEVFIYGNTVISSNIARKLSYLFSNISSNDIIWIKFEELELEIKENDLGIKKRTRTLEDRVISKSILANQVYDMIGLVDSIIQVQNVGQGTGSVTITGQSLVKLFTDDEAIFLPLAVVSDSNTGNLLIGSSKQTGLLNRLFSDGNYYFLFAKLFRTIDDTMKFYLNQLSNIGIIPISEVETEQKQNKVDDFFSSYGDRRTKIYKLKNEEYTKNGISQKVDVLSSELARGIYQIIKLSFDPAIKDRRITDTTISSPEGSLLSLFGKVCQQPLVEILMDTYIDTFNLVIRKPPFDKESLLDFTTLTEDQNSSNPVLTRDYNTSVEYPLGGVDLGSVTVRPSQSTGVSLFEINIEDVAEENLTWNTEFYTWYKFEAKASFLGNQDSTSLARVPIVYFSEFVDLWGSKPYNVVSNYNIENKIGSKDDKMQIISDLLYLISSTIYLPFTRRGTLILNKGDRRIKKGTWIKYNKTGELFYVESVMNTCSIDSTSVNRQTNLVVSRGIVNRHLDKYFNIVDLVSLKESLKEFMLEGKSKISREMKVNPDIFNFFCQRRQFSE